LRAFARVDVRRERPYITREKLRATIDITGVNRILTIAQVAAKVEKRLAKIQLPRDYSIELGGTRKDMMQTQKRLMRSLLIGLILLYVLLLAMFRSFVHPLTILSAIPLAMAGGLWGLLLFDKPRCMPANMGMIFLAGTVINNSVLLLDFIVHARQDGQDRDTAIREAVRLRLRPILMTTFSTIVGLSPLVFEMAVGLERMSPLAVVASIGLLFGTITTLVVVPVVYSVFDDLAIRIRRLLGFLPNRKT
jgi:multidrug efflux pump subunit AcrB